MDFGIAGRTALVCAASRGIGKGCAMALAREGVNLVITARGREALEATAAEIRAATGVKVTAVAGDITTPEGRAAALAACPSPDILVNNAGGPPAGDFREWDRDVWIRAIDANMLTPIELIKATVDGMIARRFGRIINITSAAVKAPIDMLGLSTARAPGLPASSPASRGRWRGTTSPSTTCCRARSTPRGCAPTAEAFARGRGITVEKVASRSASSAFPLAGSARPRSSAPICAFLCSTQASYLVGQNVLVDGGAYPGTFLRRRLRRIAVARGADFLYSFCRASDYCG